MKNDFASYFKGKLKTRFKEFVSREFDYKILPRKKRLISLIAASQAAGKKELLRGLIFWSLSSNIKPEEIYEVLLQGYLFCGYPAAIESFFIFNEVINNNHPTIKCKPENDNTCDYDSFRNRGLETARKIYGKNFNLVYNNIKILSEDLASGMIVEGYGRIISRQGLDILSRELAVVSALSVMGMPRQLYSHIRGAINAGATYSQIEAVINQNSILVNPTKIKKALQVLKKSLGI